VEPRSRARWHTAAARYRTRGDWRIWPHRDVRWHPRPSNWAISGKPRWLATQLAPMPRKASGKSGCFSNSPQFKCTSFSARCLSIFRCPRRGASRRERAGAGRGHSFRGANGLQGDATAVLKTDAPKTPPRCIPSSSPRFPRFGCENSEPKGEKALGLLSFSGKIRLVITCLAIL
jgi:hypothetical protein